MAASLELRSVIEVNAPGGAKRYKIKKMERR
jgi:hypothetical protein